MLLKKHKNIKKVKKILRIFSKLLTKSKKSEKNAKKSGAGCINNSMRSKNRSQLNTYSRREMYEEKKKKKGSGKSLHCIKPHSERDADAIVR